MEVLLPSTASRPRQTRVASRYARKSQAIVCMGERTDVVYALRHGRVCAYWQDPSSSEIWVRVREIERQSFDDPFMPLIAADAFFLDRPASLTYVVESDVAELWEFDDAALEGLLRRHRAVPFVRELLRDSEMRGELQRELDAAYERCGIRGLWSEAPPCDLLHVAADKEDAIIAEEAAIRAFSEDLLARQLARRYLPPLNQPVRTEPLHH